MNLGLNVSLRLGRALGWIACASLAFAAVAQAEATRLTYPSAAYAELGGRFLGYGAGFDRVVSPEMSAGVGIGMTPLQDASGHSANKSATLIPAYINYYLDEDENTLFLTAGMTLVSGDPENLKAKYSGLEFSSRSVLPTLGWGYESRSDSSFLFRLSGYGIWGKKILPWVGFTFGYAF